LRTTISPPIVRGMLPNIYLAVPKKYNERKYLGFGLFDADSIKISPIKANVVIIEIFSMYCPYCQRETHNVNGLYQTIENDPSLTGKIKLKGVGAGNTSYEVNVFKDKYNISFPLFEDPVYFIHKSLGEVRTPYFIAIKINEDGSHKVIYSKLGAFEGVHQFLTTIIKLDLR
jgi:peroxiredoxin